MDIRTLEHAQFAIRLLQNGSDEDRPAVLVKIALEFEKLPRPGSPDDASVLVINEIFAGIESRTWPSESIASALFALSKCAGISGIPNAFVLAARVASWTDEKWVGRQILIMVENFIDSGAAVDPSLSDCLIGKIGAKSCVWSEDEELQARVISKIRWNVA